VAVRLPWLDSMSVGILEFDADHREFIDLVNAIAVKQEERDLKGVQELGRRLKTLAVNHQRREEDFLTQIGYPNKDQLIAAQSGSLERIARLIDAMSTDPKDADLRVQDMQNALVEYLLCADINFKSFIEAAGLSDV
jgi:hemerythrin-like metal-binding protein